MRLKAALLATLAVGACFLTACGGGGDGGGGGSSPGSQPQQSPPASEPQQSPPASEPQQLPPTSQPQQLPPATCQPQTIVGGALFVAEQAPVGVTLLSNGGLTQYIFNFMYDNVFGIPTNNRQDKWGGVTLFPPGTPVGTSTQVQILPFGGFVHGEQTPSTFPKGIPLELWLTWNPPGTNHGLDDSSSTASIGKDIRDFPHTGSVTYGANNTATVTFTATGGSTGFSVGLTNVLGPTSSGGGC